MWSFRKHYHGHHTEAFIAVALSYHKKGTETEEGGDRQGVGTTAREDVCAQPGMFFKPTAASC
jgi:hypothetical protein